MRLADAVFAMLMTLPVAEAIFLGLMALMSLRYREPPGEREPQARVAVLVATRDEETELVKRCVDSALKSSSVKRVIVVDDSGVEAYTKLREALRNGRVVLVHREVNRGFKPGALNDALRLVEEEVLVVADADTVLGAFPDTAVRLISESFDVVQSSTSPLEVRDVTSACFAVITLFRNCILAPGCAAMGLPFISGYGYAVKRLLLERMGGWSEDTVAEDLELSLRLALVGVKYSYLSSVEVLEEPPSSIASLRAQQRRWMGGSIQVMLRSLRKALREPRALLYTPITALFTGLLANDAAAISALLSPLIGAPSPMALTFATILLNAPLTVVTAKILLAGWRRLGFRNAVKGLLITALLYNALSPYILLDLVAAVLRHGDVEWVRTGKGRVRGGESRVRAYLPSLTLYVAAAMAALACSPLLAPWLASLVASTVAISILELLT